MSKRLQLFPVHPFLFVAYFFAFLYANNLGRVNTATMALPFGLAIGIVAVIYVVLYRATRDVHRGALLTSLLVLLFFAYGHAYGWVYSRVSVTPLMLHLLLTQTVLALLLVGQMAIRRARDVKQATVAAHLMAALLLIMASLPLMTGGSRGEANGPTWQTSAVEPGVGVGHDAPDIYLIVLDSYARRDVLEQHYQFDNQVMLDSLRAIGFQISEHSNSNYTWTFLSLASLLNMRYLDELATGPRERGLTPSRAESLVRTNQVVDLLQTNGYRYIHFNSTFGATRNSPIADEQVHCRGAIFDEEAYRALIESTWLRVLDFAVASDLARCHLHQFEQLASVAGRPGPKFVFAHFIPPHHPYLFDREGKVLRRATIANQMQFQRNLWADRDGYLEQLLFVNDRVLDVIGRILEESEAEPVIVLMSDHGPQLPEADNHTFLAARFANLTAMYLPDLGRIGNSTVPADITPVNIFRLVLGQYLGFELPTLPNRHIFSTFHDPYAFVDVTSELPTHGDKGINWDG
jgi:hypothetical protein